MASRTHSTAATARHLMSTWAPVTMRPQSTACLLKVTPDPPHTTPPPLLHMLPLQLLTTPLLPPQLLTTPLPQLLITHLPLLQLLITHLPLLHMPPLQLPTTP